MNTIVDSSHMPTLTFSQPSVSTLNRKPEAPSCTPRYGIENSSATSTVRMRIMSPWK